MSTLLKHVQATFLSRGAVLGLSILSAVIVSRVLGPGGRGVYTTVFLFPAFVSSLGILGMAASSLYFTSQEPEKGPTLVGMALWLSLGFSVLFAAGVALFYPFLREAYYGSVDVTAYVLLGLAFGPLSIVRSFLGSTLRGTYDIRSYNLLTGHGFHALRLAVLFLTLVVLGWGVVGAIATQLFVYVASDVGILWVLLRSQGLDTGFGWELFRKMFRYGIEGWGGSALSRANDDSDALLVAAFMDPAELGLFSVALMMAAQMRIVGDSVRTALLPKVASLKERAQALRYIATPTRNMLPVLLAILLAYLLLGRLAIRVLHGAAFLPSFLPGAVLMVGISGLILSDNFQTYYVGTGRPIVKTWVRGVGLVAHLGLLAWLLPRWGIMGAAWANASGGLTMLATYVILFRRETGVPLGELFVVKRKDLRYYRRTLEAVQETGATAYSAGRRWLMGTGEE